MSSEPIAVSPDMKKPPPQNIDAEESVLGGVLLKNDAIDEIDFIRPEMFYREKHRRVYVAMLECWIDEEPIDLVTLGTRLKDAGDLDQVGGEAFLAYLAGRVPTAANIVFYGRLVRDKWLARRLKQTGAEIAQKASDPDLEITEVLNEADRIITNIGHTMLRSDPVRIGEAAHEVVARSKRAAKDGISPGVKTGFDKIDNLTDGLQGGDLVVIGARPSHGKTSLEMSILLKAAFDGVPSIVFSLEMSKEKIATRALSWVAEVDSKLIRSGKMTQQQAIELQDATKILDALEIQVDDQEAITLAEMRAKARAFRRRTKSEKGIVAVDYLQLMGVDRSSSKDSRADQIAAISKGLKALAKSIGWPVMALSQLNRGVESRQDKRPTLADLRESGAIEQDADLVLFVYRPAVYEEKKPGYEEPEFETVEVIAEKNRDGETGFLRLGYQKRYTRHYNLDSFGRVKDSGVPEYKQARLI